MKTTKPENPYPTRSPRGIRSSGIQSTATRPLEIKGKKSVRFKDIDSEELPEASKRNRSSTIGDPKTSEYAFFKRFKDGTAAPRVFGSGSGSGSMPDRLKLCNSPDFVLGRRKNLEGDKHFGSLLVTGNATPEKFGSFILPLAVASKKSDVDMKKAKTMTDEVQNKWVQTLCQNSLELGEDQCKHVDIFFKKRQKLWQWVGENSFPEIADLCSKGSDFVSLLLTRLFPQRREDKCFKGLNKVQQEEDTKTELLTDPKSDIHLMNFELIPVWNTTELVYAPASDVGSLSYSSSGCELVTKTTPVSYTLGFSTPGHYLEDSGLFTSNHFKKLGEGHYFAGPLLSMESCAEDFNVMANRSSFFNCQNTELSLYPMSVSSQAYPQWNLDWFSSSGLWTEPLLSHVSSELPFNNSNIFHENLLEVENATSTALDYLSPLPCKSSGMNFDVYSSCHTRRKNDSFPQNSVQLLSKVLDEKHPHSGPEALVLSGDHGNLEQKYLLSVGVSPATDGDYHSLGYHALEFPKNVDLSSYPISTDENANCSSSFNYAGHTHHFSEDVIKIQDCSSFKFKIFSDYHKEFPLLLDKPCPYQSEEDEFSNNSEWIYS